MLLYKNENEFLTQVDGFTFVSDGKGASFAVLAPLQVKVPEGEVQCVSCWHFQAPHTVCVVGVGARVVLWGHGATHETQECVPTPITCSGNNSQN